MVIYFCNHWEAFLFYSLLLLATYLIGKGET